MSGLETTLATLGESVDWPEPSDHLANRVGARIRSGRLLGTPPRWAVAAVVLAALALLVGLVPGPRQAVADLLHEAGVRIGFFEPGTSDMLSDLDLGERIGIEDAPRRAGFELRAPAVLGPPESAHLDGGVVTLVWDGPILLTQRAGGGTYAQKGLGPETKATGVAVAGEPGLWIEGAEHTFTLLDADGDPVVETSRLAANVLLWNADGVDYRLELTGPLDRALEIAGSLEEVG